MIKLKFKVKRDDFVVTLHRVNYVEEKNSNVENGGWYDVTLPQVNFQTLIQIEKKRKREMKSQLVE